ncbi:unnamed protein product [Leuciscus chuanchicus]
MSDCYYNGGFARRTPGAVHSRGDRRSRQGRKTQRSDIGDGRNPPKLASVKQAYNNLGKCWISPGLLTGPYQTEWPAEVPGSEPGTPYRQITPPEPGGQVPQWRRSPGLGCSHLWPSENLTRLRDLRLLHTELWLYFT